MGGVYRVDEDRLGRTALQQRQTQTPISSHVRKEKVRMR